MDTCRFADDLEDLPSHELEDQLLTLNAHITAAVYRFLMLVRTLDARMAWAEMGMRSMAHWLNWRCGIDVGTAREQVRVARALGALPLTSAAFAAGTISYSKVRAMTRVASAATEPSLLNIAEYGTASQMEKTVRLIKQGMALEDPDRLRAMVERCECDWVRDDDGMLVFRARLMPDDGARLVKALQALEVFEGGEPVAQRRARALVDMAEAAVAGSATGVSVPEIVAHIRHEDVSAGTSVLIEDEVAVSRTTAQRLCCDAAIVPLLEDPHGEPLSIGRRTRTIPSAIRRALNARDKNCRFPGCTHSRFLHGHHIQHWANQGETALGNLVPLCSFHHLLVHEGGYSVTRRHDGVFVFFTPNGRQVEPAPGLHAGSTDALPNNNMALNIDVSAATCDSKWDGAPANYDLVLTAYFHGGTT